MVLSGIVGNVQSWIDTVSGSDDCTTSAHPAAVTAFECSDLHDPDLSGDIRKRVKEKLTCCSEAKTQQAISKKNYPNCCILHKKSELYCPGRYNQRGDICHYMGNKGQEEHILNNVPRNSSRKDNENDDKGIWKRVLIGLGVLLLFWILRRFTRKKDPNKEIMMQIRNMREDD